nr:MAG TPA: hypothetical protein [Bacteriophage sp.]
MITFLSIYLLPINNMCYCILSYISHLHIFCIISSYMSQ